MTRPNSPSWQKAKAAGDAGERGVAAWFQTRGFEAYLSPGYSGVDVLVQGRIEVKRDLIAPTSGRVAVEMLYNNSPSGLSATTATHWAFVVDNQALMVRTDRLRACIERMGCVAVPVGDRGASRCILLPIEALRGVQGFQALILPDGMSAP